MGQAADQLEEKRQEMIAFAYVEATDSFIIISFYYLPLNVPRLPAQLTPSIPQSHCITYNNMMKIELLPPSPPPYRF